MSAIGRPNLTSPTHSDGKPSVVAQLSALETIATRVTTAVNPTVQLKNRILDYLEAELKYLLSVDLITSEDYEHVGNILKPTQQALFQLYFQIQNNPSNNDYFDHAFLENAGDLHNRLIILVNDLAKTERMQ